MTASRGEIDGAALIAHVERDGREVVELLEGRREHMLAGVLLHVIATAVGVDGSSITVPGCKPGRVASTKCSTSPVCSSSATLIDAELARPALPSGEAIRCRKSGRRWWDKTPSDRAQPRCRRAAIVCQPRGLRRSAETSRCSKGAQSKVLLPRCAHRSGKNIPALALQPVVRSLSTEPFLNCHPERSEGPAFVAHSTDSPQGPESDLGPAAAFPYTKY